MQRKNSFSKVFLITVLLVALSMLTAMCAPAAAPEATEEPAGEMEEPAAGEEQEPAGGEMEEMDETITL
ncbi:MAG: hypothetical protein PVF85_10535, partial [Anaerolineales bacterium]